MAAYEAWELGLGFREQYDEDMNDHATLIAIQVAFLCISDFVPEIKSSKTAYFDTEPESEPESDEPESPSISHPTFDSDELVTAPEQAVYILPFSYNGTLVDTDQSSEQETSMTVDGQFLHKGVAVGSGYLRILPTVPEEPSIGGTGVFIPCHQVGASMHFRVPSADVILPPHVVEGLGLIKRWNLGAKA